MKSKAQVGLLRVPQHKIRTPNICENTEEYRSFCGVYYVIISQNKPENKILTISYKQCRELPNIDKCYELIKLLGITTVKPFSEEINRQLDKIQIFNKNIRRFEVIAGETP